MHWAAQPDHGQKMSTCATWVAFIGVQDGMSSVSQIQSLLVNLKQERELKCQKGKPSGQMVSYPSYPVMSKTKETSVMGKPGSHLVWQLALCLFKTAVCDVDALAINSLRSDTYVTIKKKKH